jgi:hypothetical protein
VPGTARMVSLIMNKPVENTPIRLTQFSHGGG